MSGKRCTAVEKEKLSSRTTLVIFGKADLESTIILTESLNRFGYMGHFYDWHCLSQGSPESTSSWFKQSHEVDTEICHKNSNLTHTNSLIYDTVITNLTKVLHIHTNPVIHYRNEWSGMWSPQIIRKLLYKSMFCSFHVAHFIIKQTSRALCWF